MFLTGRTNFLSVTMRNNVAKCVVRQTHIWSGVSLYPMKGSYCSYCHCLVLVSFRNGFECNFTIKLQQIKGLRDWYLCQISHLVKLTSTKKGETLPSIYFHQKWVWSLNTNDFTVLVYSWEVITQYNQGAINGDNEDSSKTDPTMLHPSNTE